MATKIKDKKTEKKQCFICHGSGKITIYENAGFAYKGPPYKTKCPNCYNEKEKKN